MKKLLTALLILICFSCGDEHDKNYPRNDTTQKEREHDETLDVVSDWAYDKCTEYFNKSIFLSNASGNRDSINKYNYFGKAFREVHTKVLSLKYRNKKHESLPKPSPLPDTIKKFYDTAGMPIMIIDGRETCYLYCLGENQKLALYYYCMATAPRPSPLPDTVKPIKDKIKMQPRWRGDDTIYVQSIPYYINDSTFLIDTSGTGYVTGEQYKYWMSKVDSAYYPKKDTSKVLLLVSDTSIENGFRSSRCWWMYGYRVRGEDILEEWGGDIFISMIAVCQYQKTL